MIHKNRTNDKLVRNIVPADAKIYWYEALGFIGRDNHEFVDEDFSREVFRHAATGFGLEVKERIMTGEEIHAKGGMIAGAQFTKRFLVMWA